MTRKALLKKALAEAEKELEKHPGDAPWSCVECYHGRPCTKALIYLYAVEAMKREVS